MRQFHNWCLQLCLFSFLCGCVENDAPSKGVPTVVFPVAESLPTNLPIPRYKFQVGQHLVFRPTESIDLMPEEGKKPDPPNEYQWDVYVTDENDDGSWRLYIRKQVKLMRETEDGPPEIRFENDILGYCDMSSDGHFRGNDLLQERSLFKVDPQQLFPPLPTSSKECVEGWTRNSPIGEELREYKATALQENQLSFAGTISLPSDINYEQVVTQRVNFDLERGLPMAVARESKADWSVNPWHVLSVNELVSQADVPEVWLETFRHEADSYVKSASKWWRTSREIGFVRSRQECQAILDESQRGLIAERDKVTLDEIKSLYDALLTLHNREAGWAIEKVERKEELYAMEPLDWETEDFQGNHHRLSDYRGKVVVLDFWYRGCGHCIDALPKIKRLVEEYRDQDVLVFGMNIDRNDSDALYVIEKFNLEYPSLRADEISKQYRVQSWPTFIVLDQNGRIAYYMEGNTAGLYDDLSSAVTQLLSSQAEID